MLSFASVSRRTASTALNAASSRSHAVLSIYVTSKVNNERMTGQLCVSLCSSRIVVAGKCLTGRSSRISLDRRTARLLVATRTGSKR